MSTTFQATRKSSLPRWSVLQRHLISQMNAAGIEFIRKYTNPDGSLIWIDEWPGMDGSDDGYEAFLSFPLLYLLGGSQELLDEGRRLWDAVTKQFSEYGQIEREYDGYYDWMHHGESGTYFYYLCMADPAHKTALERAVRFADMFSGNDPKSENFDKSQCMMRSPINGSRGPCFEMTAEDWSTHRAVLSNYLAPYEDVPGHEFEDPVTTLSWDDDETFGRILKLMNERMVPGDVPLNLNSTSLIASSYMMTGDERYRKHVVDYVAAWAERTKRNGGITPDNIGPTGKIGERMNGKWWGGYYGWRWPHGAHIVIEALTIGALNASMLSGDMSFLDLPRSQLDMLWSLREDRDGHTVIPSKHGDGGWFGYGRPHHQHYIHLYNMSQSEEDLQRMIERLGPLETWPKSGGFAKAGLYHAQPWLAYMQGVDNNFPEIAVNDTLRGMNERLDVVRADDSKVEDRDVHHWQNKNPVIPEALIQMSLGTPGPIYHGGLMHTRLRYFDPEQQRPGLPEGVAALVDGMSPEDVTVQLVNTDVNFARTVVVQAGAFSEHQFGEGAILSGEDVGNETAINANSFAVELPPGTEIRVRLGMTRFANQPTYDFPNWE